MLSSARLHNGFMNSHALLLDIGFCVSHISKMLAITNLDSNLVTFYQQLLYGELTLWKVDLVGVELMGVDFVGVDLVGMNPKPQFPSPTVSVVILSPIKMSSFLFVLCDFKLIFTCRN